MLLHHRMFMPQQLDIRGCILEFIIQAMYWQGQLLAPDQLFSATKHKNGLIIEVEELTNKPI